MTTDDTQKRREARLDAAGKTRDWGTWMMFAGGLTLTAALTAFALAEAAQIQSWARQTILTIIAILFSSGVALHAVGRSSKRTLAQLDDDRVEQAARHEEMMREIREIKRRQTFLMERPGAVDDVKVAGYRRGDNVIPLPGADTLGAIERLAKRTVRRAEDNPEDKAT